MDNCTRLNETQRKTALLTLGAIAIAGILVCSVAVVLLVIFKLYKYFTHRLALYQVLAAMSYGFSLGLELAVFDYYQNEEVYEKLCAFIALLTMYTVWTMILFTNWIILHLFCTTVSNFYNEHVKNFEVPFILIGVLFPVPFVWIPFVNGAYGLAGPWCWIKNWHNNCIEAKFVLAEVEQIAIFYVPALATSLNNIVLIAIIVCLLVCKRGNTPVLKRGQRNKALKELLPLFAYPVIFCVILIPPFFSRIYGANNNVGTVDSISTLFQVTAVFVPMWSLLPGVAQIVHICVLQWPKKLRHKSSRQHQYMQSFNSHSTGNLDKVQDTNTWHLTIEKDSYGSFETEADVPNESESDSLFLLKSVK